MFIMYIIYLGGVNKELKRRVKSMETVSDKSYLPLVAFTALRLEMGWRLLPIDAPQMSILHDRRAEIAATSIPSLSQPVDIANTLEGAIDGLGILN
jgi:hypothetical protein